MTNIPQDEIALALIGTAYLIVVGLYAWWLTRSAEGLLSAIKTREAAELWVELGAPASMKEAALDRQGRWRKFIRSQAYRSQCHPEIVARIDSFRSRTNLGLGVLAIGGVMILYLFWPLLTGA